MNNVYMLLEQDYDDNNIYSGETIISVAAVSFDKGKILEKFNELFYKKVEELKLSKEDYEELIKSGYYEDKDDSSYYVDSRTENEFCIVNPSRSYVAMIKEKEMI